jgi:hypothetical protein
LALGSTLPAHAADSLTSLGFLGTGTSSYTNGVSADGNVVVVYSQASIDQSFNGHSRLKVQYYAIDVKPGEYAYSCPLNPMQDYKLVVS